MNRDGIRFTEISGVEANPKMDLVYQGIAIGREKQIGFILADRGLSVPEDVSVVSFDDAELQQEQKVKLLSAVHPKYQLGRITAKNLLRMMEDENWQERNYSYRFPVKLNDGNSVRAIDRR